MRAALGMIGDDTALEDKSKAVKELVDLANFRRKLIEAQEPEKGKK